MKISKLSLTEVLEAIALMLEDGKKHRVVTPNPEYIIDAQENSYFKDIINTADLQVPDGNGLVFAAKYFEEVKKVKKCAPLHIISYLLIGLKVGMLGFLKPKYLDVMSSSVTGADLMMGVLKRFSKRGKSVYLIGTTYQNDSSSDKSTKSLLEKEFPDIRFIGSCSGRVKRSNGNFDFVPVNEVINTIANDLDKAGLSQCDFIFVAFRHIDQETWIFENLDKLPARIVMGVGGTFDFIRGAKKRAPKIIRNLKLEWLFRLISDPTWERFIRILRAFPYFPLLVYYKSLTEY